MPKKYAYLKVPKTYGEKAITITNKMKILSKELKIKRNGTFLCLPITRKLTHTELSSIKKQIPNLRTSITTFNEKKTTKTFIELLENELPPHLFASVPRSLDIIGDIAVIEIPPELEDHKNLIGEAVLKAHKTVETVLAKAGPISGPYRLRKFRTIAGKPKTKTIHKENGCQYHVDLAKVYFSPRLSHEHGRVASLVKNGETIIDLFSGVGPFAILIAKTHKNVKVYAVDANPYAIDLLKENIRLNRVEDKVYPILGDANRVAEEKLSGMGDRVIMNLPEKALEFVNAACITIKPAGGIVHFYGFVTVSDSLGNMKLKFRDAVEMSGRKLKRITSSRLVRATAPYEWQAVIDVKVY